MLLGRPCWRRLARLILVKARKLPLVTGVGQEPLTSSTGPQATEGPQRLGTGQERMAEGGGQSTDLANKLEWPPFDFEAPQAAAS